MAHVSSCPPLTRDSVVAAHALIRPHVHLTPVLTNRTLSELASQPRDLTGTDFEGEEAARPTVRLWFKCENLQRVGAFKVRGAFHALARMMMEDGWEEDGGRERGVVTHSSGNHAQALALAAQEHKMPAHIVMPANSVPQKVAATKGYGANVYFSGSTAAERQVVADRVLAETGARLVPPYDHPDIILGQGTLGLELQEQVCDEKERRRRRLLLLGEDAAADGQPPSPEQQQQQDQDQGLDAIVAPCGGGGMLSGVAISAEKTGIRVFGAEPSFQGADDARRGLETGSRVTRVESMTVADGLRTPLGEWPWTIMHERRLVRAVYAVSDEDIKRAMRLVWERMKLVVEPSGCVGLAVVLYNEHFRRLVEHEAGPRGWDLGIVLSGGNVALDAAAAIFASA